MKFSIIMPSLNQRPFIEAAVRSVLDQRGEFALELWIIDGGSRDGSTDFLRGLSDARVHWSSAPDAGQSDAVNKGLSRATGDIIGWLNSDDLYAPGALATVAEQFAAQPERPWLVGRCGIVDGEGHEVRRGITRYKDRALRRYSFKALLRENFISQMGVFWRRAFGQRVGPLDTTLRYTMDYDLWLRMARQCDPLIVDCVLAQFRVHGASKSGGGVNRAQFDEDYAVARRYAGTNRMSLWVHRLNVEKIVWGYRLMRLLGR
jgi:glycosyltransferase involved in cell wall biosynthesis